MRFGFGLSVQHPPEDPQALRFRDHLEQVEVRLLGERVLPHFRRD
jgi:hypothetical protein